MRIKMVSPDYVMVILQIDHPFFGSLIVDTFQRRKTDIESDVEKKIIKWNGLNFPITRSTKVLVDETNTIPPSIYVCVPWNYLGEPECL